ncbi:MAG TPA: hypothetical protein VMS32_01905 [Verrucomicrobiae bacterium]|jgi:hypothetical protein|nr:hypothetical protein [Verrucomicrobiae bacterium]
MTAGQIERGVSRPHIVSALVGAAIVVWLVLRPLWAMHGIPAFNHDWSWPPDRIQAWSQFRDAISPFTANNFGQLNFYIGSAPSALVAALAVQMFGAQLGVKILSSLLLFGALLAAFALAKRLGATPVVGVSCALVYAASPVVANEMAAGHLGYLFGYAALPIITLSGLQLAMGSRRTLAVLALIVVVPFSIAQPQFIAFDALVILVLVPWARTGRDRLVLVLTALAILCASPYEIVLVLFSHPLTALSADRANLHWEAANSSALWKAYIGSAYVRPYDAGVPAALLAGRAAAGVLLWLIAIVNVVRTRRWTTFLALTVLAAWLNAGANGPLWSVMSFAFAHVPQLAIFRELYHFSGLIMLGLLTLCALSRLRPITWVLPLAAILFALPQLTGDYWQLVSTYDNAEIATVARIVNADRGTGLVMFWPLLQPLGESAALAGADPDAFAIGSHPSLSEFVPVQPLSQLGALMCDSKRDPGRILAQFGVRYVIVRTTWRSFYDQRMEPGLRDLVAGRDPQNCADDRVLRGLQVVWRGESHALALVSVPTPRVGGTLFADPVWRLPIERAFDPSDLTADPRRGWVDGNRWQWWDPTFYGPVNPGIFSMGHVAYELPIHSGGMQMFANAPEGLLFAGSSVRYAVRGARGFRAIRIPDGASVVTALGPTMLAGLAAPYRAGSERAPWYVPVRTLGAPIALALIAQYLCWFLSLAALPTLFLLYIRDRRRPGPHNPIAYDPTPTISDRAPHI